MGAPVAVTRRGRLIAVGIGFAAVVFLAFAAEGAIRVRSLIKHGHADLRIETLYEIDEASGLRVPVANAVVGKIKINNFGFRSPEIEKAKPSNTTRVAFLGGSTTFSSEVSGNEATWSHLVIEYLREHYPDQQFDYINGGVPGYAARHSLNNLETRISAFSPDAVVIYHASNDLSGNSSQAAARQGILHVREKDQISWLGRYSLLWYLVEKNLRIMLLQSAAGKPAGKILVDTEALSAPFRRDLSDLVRVAKRHARQVVLVTFSIQLRREQSIDDQKSASVTSLYYMPYMSISGLLDAFATYNRVISEVAIAESVSLIANEELIPGDSFHFVDSVHLSDRGSRVMADRVYQGLVAARVFEARPDVQSEP